MIKVSLPKNSLRRILIEDLWFTYGNNGKYHTMRNHRYIQCLLEQEEDHKDFFKPEQQCLAVVKSIMTAEIYRHKVAQSTNRFNVCGRVFQLPKDFKGDHVVAVYRKEPLKIINIYYVNWPVGFKDIGKMREV